MTHTDPAERRTAPVTAPVTASSHPSYVPGRGPVHVVTVPDLGEVRLDVLDPAGEAAVVHAWTRDERADFWMMRDKSLEEVREIYVWLDEQPTHATYLVRLDGTPVGLFQTYDPRVEEVAEHLEVRDGDLGLHAMVGPHVGASRAGFTMHLTAVVLGWVFADPAVGRVLGEPDARNARMQALAERAGARTEGTVELSVKPATLTVLDREAYEAVFGGTSGAPGS